MPFVVFISVQYLYQHDKPHYGVEGQKFKQESPTLNLPYSLQGQQAWSFCLDFGFTFIQHALECAFEICRKELVHEAHKCVGRLGKEVDMTKYSIMWKQTTLEGVFSTIKIQKTVLLLVSCCSGITARGWYHHYTGSLPYQFSRCYFNNNVIQPQYIIVQEIPQHFSLLLSCFRITYAFLIHTYHLSKELPSANTFSQT